MERASENQKAGQKPSTLKPWTNLLSIKIIIVLITSRKIPSVRIVIGSVRITRMGFTIKSRILKTNATNIAVPYVFMDTPGIKLANIYANAATTNMRIMKFIYSSKVSIVSHSSHESQMSQILACNHTTLFDTMTYTTCLT